MKFFAVSSLFALLLLSACQAKVTLSPEGKERADEAGVDIKVVTSENGASPATSSNQPNPAGQSDAPKVAQSFDLSAWNGIWKTSEGTMTLQHSQEIREGTLVQGSYSQDGGKIEGSISDITLQGYWAENSSSQKCDEQKLGSFYWGRIVFAKTDAQGNKFEGKWGYCDTEPDLSWTGERTGALASSPAAPSAESNDSNRDRSKDEGSTQPIFAGVWDTSEGKMELKYLDDSVVSGFYSQDGGKIRGSVTGRDLIGYWIEEGSSQKCDEQKLNSFHWGRIVFTVNEANDKFEGKWSYCDAEPDISWTGKRPNT